MLLLCLMPQSLYASAWVSLWLSVCLSAWLSVPVYGSAMALVCMIRRQEENTHNHWQIRVHCGILFVPLVHLALCKLVQPLKLVCSFLNDRGHCKYKLPFDAFCSKTTSNWGPDHFLLYFCLNIMSHPAYNIFSHCMKDSWYLVYMYMCLYSLMLDTNQQQETSQSNIYGVFLSKTLGFKWLAIFYLQWCMHTIIGSLCHFVCLSVGETAYVVEKTLSRSS